MRPNNLSFYLAIPLLLSVNVNAAMTVKYQHTDVLGSLIAETDSNGNIIQKTHYQAYGEQLGGQKAGIGYTGHLEDTDLELTYMQQRYYDHAIGRFYSNDPVGFSTANLMMFNRYAYANNNPYKFVDPDGRCSTGSRIKTVNVAGCYTAYSIEDIKGSSNNPYGKYFPKVIWPTASKTVTSKFTDANREIISLNLKRPHKGIDIRQPLNAKSVSTEYGVISKVVKSSTGENSIHISNYDGSKSIYRHQSATVSKGDHVVPGQTIGFGDGSGYITGPHLHYEYIPADGMVPADPLNTQLQDLYENQ